MFVLHCCVSELDPAHFFPPLAGAGFVHVLDREWLPPPQEAEQGPHGFHVDHLPSTSGLEKREIYNKYFKKNLKIASNGTAGNVCVVKALDTLCCVLCPSK